MKYILTSEQRRQNAIDHLKEADIATPLEVHIKPYKKNRSRSQNNTLWMWYKPLADHLGYTPEDLHECLKVKFLGVEEYEVKGEILRRPKSTRKLSTREMADFLEKVELLAKSQLVALPYPDDFKFCMFIKEQTNE